MLVAQNGMGGDEATQVKHLAEVGRSRSGLFGFCRPRKTVSPVIQQGFHDLTSHAKCRTISCGGTADDGQQACPQPDSDSAWSTLPEHLIEAIMQMLQAPPAVHHNNRAAIQTQFAATSVSKSWRQVGRRAFFRSLWDQSGAIKHPVQLFGLSPATPPAQLTKCDVRREYDSTRPKAVKYVLRLSDRAGASTFMMSALQVSRLDIKIFLSSSCNGPPCAQIETNLLGTKYELVLDRTVQPFAQHQATHSHTPLLTYGKLSSMQSMHSMRSASCDFDVPVVDLPATSPTHCSSATSTSADEADLEESQPLSAADSRRILGCIAETHFEDTQSGLHASTSAPSSLLTSFRPARRGRSEQPLPSPFAALAERPDHNHQFGANLPPSAPASPTSPSFLARYHSAKDTFIASRSNSSVPYPPTPSTSPSASASFPASFPTRSQSGKPGSSSQPPGSCDNPACSCHVVPKSVGGVQYKTRLRGFMRPRRMKVSLPNPAVLACFDTSASSSSHSTSHSTFCSSQCRCSTSLPDSPTVADDAASPGSDSAGSSGQPPGQPPLPEASESSQRMAPTTPRPSQTGAELPATPHRKSSSFSSPNGVELRNKAPHWNDTLRCWCLNFRGRVKLASVKNFQLIKADDPNKTIVMQFGKVDSYSYIMDYNPAEISAIQAFAISLSTFDTKLLL